MSNLTQRDWKPLLFVLLSALIVLCYSPGIHGPYIFDDIPNITENTLLKLESFSFSTLWSASTSIKSGPFYRPISMLSFVFNLSLFGTDAFYFKLTNILIHLFTAIALYHFLCRLLNIPVNQQTQCRNQHHITALIITSLWALHPINLTSVLYIVQRMTSLSALFTILALSFYISGRTRLNTHHKTSLIHIALSFFVFFPFALLCKETAALFPFYLFLLEWLIFRFERPNTLSAWIVFAVIAGAVSALVLPFIYLSFINPDWLQTAYQTRSFTLSERLLTEPRIIGFYLKLILLPDITQMGLFHDDIIVSTSWRHPITTLPAILGLIVLISYTLKLNKQYRYIQFGILFFLIGHSLESTFVPLELAHEHRNYLPSTGIIIALVYLFKNLLRLTPKAIAAITTISILSLASLTALRAQQWSTWETLLSREQRNHPNSSRINFESGRALLIAALENNIDTHKNILLEKASIHLEKAATLEPSDLGPQLALLRIAYLQHPNLPEDAYRTLLTHINTLPMTQPNIRQLSYFLRCKINHYCNYPVKLAEALLQAAQNNPGTQTKDLALLLNDLAILYFNAEQKHDALNTLKHAINLDADNIMFWQNALRIAASMENPLYLDTLIQKIEQLQLNFKIDYQTHQDALWKKSQ